MKRIDRILLFAVAACAAAAIYRYGFADAPAETTRSGPVKLNLARGSLLEREYSPSAPLADGAKRGQILIRPEEHTRLVGLAGAMMCPSRLGAPDFFHGQNVTAVQTPDGLYLKDWIQQRKPSTKGVDWYLLYALWLDSSQGREWRTGWSRVNLVDLSSTGVEVRPKRGATAVVEVVTANGQPLPGALVAIDERQYEPGRFLQYGFTDGDGRLRVTGLETDRRWSFSLPVGVGPSTDGVRVTTPIPADTVRLAAPLSGSWSYLPLLATPFLRGGALHLDRVVANADDLPTVWSVSKWIGPGRGTWAPFYLMYRSDLAAPERVELGFRGCLPEHVGPDERWKKITLRPDPEASRKAADPLAQPPAIGAKKDGTCVDGEH